MIERKYFHNALLGGITVAFVGAQAIPGTNDNGPVVTTVISMMSGNVAAKDTAKPYMAVQAPSKAGNALDAFQHVVRPLSHSRALGDAFRSYFAYKAANPDQVKKPLLYFVDYGLPSTTPRGYVFNMDSLRIVDGPFMVAHGRGSAADNKGIPTRFSNVPNSYATSLGLYVAQETYAFSGKSGGKAYGSVGLRLQGVSDGYNDNARVRKVVAHGAPYVTPDRAGRSEGCPAMEQARARRLLPALANGALVFLFAPNEEWMERDPWVTASAG